MLVGYIRVSTEQQDAQLQRDAMEKAGVEKIYEEIGSGADDDRPEIAKLLSFVREGDTVVVWKLDRLGRSLPKLVETVNDLNARGIGFKSLTQANVDTTTPNGRLIFNIFASLAEYERELIKERTWAGKVAKGKFGGRQPLGAEKIALIKGYRAEGKSWRQVAKLAGVSLSTLHKYAMPKGAKATA